MQKIQKKDWIQIVLNVIAFVILFSAPTGKGSFWGFTTFFVLCATNLIEILLSKDRTAIWLWITKTITYSLFVWKFSSNIGPFHWEYVMMVAISFCTLLISRHLIKRRSIAMWGSNVASVIGGVLYIIAVVNKPEDYGYHHILFWLVNAISYGLLIQEIIHHKKHRVNLIIPIYGFTFSLLYMMIIYWY